MIRTLILLLLFLAFASKSIVAQEYESFRNYNMSHGLPTNSIYQLMIDSKGRVWFGSDLGVTFFDGQKFETYTTEDGLIDNTVLRCFEDSKGRIWFHHNNKLPSLWENGVIKHLKLDKSLSGKKITVNSGSFFVEMDNSKIYLGCYEGFLEIDWQLNGRIQNYQANQMITTNMIYKNGLLFSVEETAKNFNPPANIITHDFTHILDQINFRTGISSNTHTRSYPFIMKNYSKETRVMDFPKLKEESQFIEAFYIVEHGSRTYYATKNGIFIYFKRNGEYFLLQHLLPGIQVVSVDFDQQNNMFASSFGGGFFYFPKKKIETIKLPPLVRITAQTKYNGNLIIGTPSGEIYECDGKSIKPFEFNGSSLNMNTKIGSVYFEKNGNFVVSGEESIRYSTPLKKGLLIKPSSAFGVAYDTERQRFYFCSSYGLFYFEPKSNFYRYFIGIGKVKEVAIYDNILYASTQNGLYKFVNNKYIPVFQKVLNSIRVNDLLTFQKKLFFSTAEKGIWIYDGEKLVNFTSKDGLLSNNTSFLCGSKNDGFWVVTDIGLQKFKIVNQKLIELKRVDLKSNINSNEILGLEEIENHLMITSNNGLFAIALNQDFPLSKIALRLENFLLNNKLVGENDIRTFPYGKNLKIKASAVNFTQHPTEYFYRINKGDWVKNNSETFFFPLLSPGDYKLEVFARSPFFKDSEIETINISVREKWFQNVYLWIIGFLILSIGIILFLRRHALIQAEKKRKELKTELLSLQSQMNPHFTFNSLNSIQSYLGTHDRREAQIYLADFAGLMRSILDQAKLNLISLDKEAAFLKSYLDLEKRRLEGLFEYEIIIDKTIDPGKDSIPTLMLQPFVENAVWHGVAGKSSNGLIIVRFSKKDNKITCQIEDNGPGLEMESKRKKIRPYHKSKGIENCKERIDIFEEIYNKKIELNIESKDALNHGTLVTVKFPIMTLNEK